MSQFLILSPGALAIALVVILVVLVGAIIWAHAHGKNVANAEAKMAALATEVRHSAQVAQATTMANVHVAIQDVKAKVDAMHTAITAKAPTDTTKAAP